MLSSHLNIVSRAPLNSFSTGHTAQIAMKFVGKIISKPSPPASMLSVYFTILSMRCENYHVKWTKSQRTYLLRLSAVSSCWIYQQQSMGQIFLKEIREQVAIQVCWYQATTVAHSCSYWHFPQNRSLAVLPAHTWAVGSSSWKQGEVCWVNRSKSVGSSSPHCMCAVSAASN